MGLGLDELRSLLPRTVRYGWSAAAWTAYCGVRTGAYALQQLNERYRRCRPRPLLLRLHGPRSFYLSSFHPGFRPHLPNFYDRLVPRSGEGVDLVLMYDEHDARQELDEEVSPRRWGWLLRHGGSECEWDVRRSWLGGRRRVVESNEYRKVECAVTNSWRGDHVESDTV